MCVVERDRIFAVVAQVPCSAGAGDAIGGDARRAVAGDVGADKGGVLRESAGAADGDVGGIKRGEIDRHVVAVGDRESVVGGGGSEIGRVRRRAGGFRIGDVEGEGAQRACWHGQAADVGDLAGPHGDGVRARVERIPRATGSVDAISRHQRAAVGELIGTGERGGGREGIRPGDLNVGRVERGELHREIIGIGNGEARHGRAIHRRGSAERRGGSRRIVQAHHERPQRSLGHENIASIRHFIGLHADGVGAVVGRIPHAAGGVEAISCTAERAVIGTGRGDERNR